MLFSEILIIYLRLTVFHIRRTTAGRWRNFVSRLSWSFLWAILMLKINSSPEPNFKSPNKRLHGGQTAH